MTSLAAVPLPSAVYDGIAHRYAAAHRRWLSHAGGSAQTAIEAAMALGIRPGARVLDAGCGRGDLARRVLSRIAVGARMTLVDPSPEMLAGSLGIPVRRYLARMERLPFDADSFDAVICTWALEACGAPDTALDELLRVLAPGGVLFLVCCADRPARTPVAALMRRVIERRRSGAFLDVAQLTAQLRAKGIDDITDLPCEGPAAALVVRRPLAPVSASRLSAIR